LLDSTVVLLVSVAIHFWLCFQAGQWLHSQAGLSSQALSDAKNEVLALQEIVHQKDTELTELHNALRNRDDTIQQLVLRLDSVTRDYTAAHEEGRLLRERVREIEATNERERQEFRSMLADLRGESADVEKESARLAFERLHKENEALRQREAENAVVVSRLMADIEAQRKGGQRNTVTSSTSAASTSIIVYSKEEHDADLERQLSALRAELDELYGEEISRMKEQMRERQSAAVERLERELSTASAERSRLASQSTMWQQQYMMLSQQSVTDIDVAQRLNDAIADGIKQRQLVAELTERVAELNMRLSKQHSTSPSIPEESSSELDRYKQQMAERIATESRSLRTKLDELNVLLTESNADRDRLVTRLRALESELEGSRKELKNAQNQYSEELQRFEAQAAKDISELATQLASSKEQIKALHLASTGTDEQRQEIGRISRDHLAQIEAMKASHENFIKETKAEHLSQLQQLSNEYSEQLDLMNAKLTAAIRLAEERDFEHVSRLEELKLRHEQAQAEHEIVVAKLREQITQPVAVPEILAHTQVSRSADVEQQSPDAVVAHLASRLEKVTRERDSAMHSLSNVYTDRIEMKQSLDSLELQRNELESERNSLVSRVAELDGERLILTRQLQSSEAELQKLKVLFSTGNLRNTTGLTQFTDSDLAIPYSLSLTDVPDETGSDVIDKLREEFKELQRLRREKDLADDGPSVSGRLSDMADLEVQTEQATTVAQDISSTVYVESQVSVVETNVIVERRAEQVSSDMTAEELATMKQEYALLYAELVRVRETLLTLQRADHEREQLREHFENEVRLLRDALLIQNARGDGVVDSEGGQEVPAKGANDTGDLEKRLTSALSRIEELLCEKDSQREVYECELEQARSEHSEALKRLDALVQEHNVIVGGQHPLSAVDVSHVTVELPTVDEDAGDEDTSPKRVVFDSQAREIERLREQLHHAAHEIETLLAEKARLSSSLESSTSELLSVIEKIAKENEEQQLACQKKVDVSSQEIDRLNRQLDELSALYEQTKVQQTREIERLTEEHQRAVDELSSSAEERNCALERELVATRKRCADLQSEIERVVTEKDSLEQECSKVLLEVNREHESRVLALRKDFELELEEVRQELTNKKDDNESQLEEHLLLAQQEIEQLKEELLSRTENDLMRGETRKRSDERRPPIEDLETVQVLHLRINDLTETKVALQSELSNLQAANQRLLAEVKTITAERESLAEQMAAQAAVVDSADSTFDVSFG
jgi:chromosome segregation ATPase